MLSSFEISRISLSTSFLMILTRLLKFMCPILMCKSQLSSSLAKKQPSFLISSKVYISFGFLVVVSTNLLDFSLLILHFFESNNMCPWSHIWLTLSRLWFNFSMSKINFAPYLFLLILIVPFPITFVEPSFLNEIVPSLSSYKDTIFFLSPIICVEKPLSTYLTLLLLWAFKEMT